MKYLKQYKLFESKNLTTQIHEKVLNEYFEFTSDEIKEWCGDILDEYPELDFEVLVAKRTDLRINVYLKGYTIDVEITKEKYPISEESISFIKERLKEYNCHITPYLSHYTEDIYYAMGKDFLSFQIAKNI